MKGSKLILNIRMTNKVCSLWEGSSITFYSDKWDFKAHMQLATATITDTPQKNK